jgi:predicted metal-binding membrane protein
MPHNPTHSTSSTSGGVAARRSAISALVLGVGIAWAAVLLGPSGMGAGPVVFVLAWTVMMVAMMLPSAAPFILLYRQGSSGRDTAILTAGYVLVWALAGIPAYVFHERLPMAVGPVALAAAGVYQLTPLKTACLHHCRTPADFLVQRWGRAPLRLGIEHGAWCLGCCWALMVVLVMVGSMGLAWVVGIAALVAVEKLTRRGVLWARLGGVALLLAAILQGIKVWTGDSMDMS